MKKRMILLVAMFGLQFIFSTCIASQDSSLAVLEGKVVGTGEYKLLIQNVRTGDSFTVMTNSQGTYKTEVMPGRYRTTLLEKHGFPVSQQRSPFNIQPGKTIQINYVAIPIGLDSSLTGARYISRYSDDNLPTSITYYLPSSDDFDLRELRIIYKTVSANQNTARFSYSFVSYEQFYLHAAVVIYDYKNKTIMAYGSKDFGDVSFEDGLSHVKSGSVTINLRDLSYKLTN